ncbi:MAG: aminoacetone oxidase family FAD-binding enzyme [Clostridia bacterium]|nr:aminoacetone oxidase family FAD-binding enzyme [Clostridia bacterium]
MKKKTIRDMIIIGGGASGLMAAIAAKSQDSACDVLVLEKNPLLAKKIYATGNGRCNFLNRYAKPESYYSRDREKGAPDFLQSAFSAVPITRLENEFQRLGILAAAEEEGRLYPRSFQAKSIVVALCQELESKEVAVILGAAVKSCKKEGDSYKVTTQDGEEFYGYRVVLATGGKAGCQYGSEGDGYKIAQAFGHRVVKPIPSLTQIITLENTENFFGVRAKASVGLWQIVGESKKLVAQDFGEVQFTKEGISGICTFNLSRFLELGESVSYALIVDPFYDYELSDLRVLLAQRYVSLADRPSGSILYGLLPEKLCDEILRRTAVHPSLKVRDISQEQLQKLSENAKFLDFSAVRTKSWSEAQVTAGGVVLSEVKSETLESKISEGLFFAGEILDVDGPCGGFNLSWAFASGYLVGMAASKRATC